MLYEVVIFPDIMWNSMTFFINFAKCQNFPDTLQIPVMLSEVSFSLTLCEIPWRFSSILPNVKISLTLCKIPWQFPDLEKFYFSLTFYLTAMNPEELWMKWTENLPNLAVEEVSFHRKPKVELLQLYTFIYTRWSSAHDSPITYCIASKGPKGLSYPDNKSACNLAGRSLEKLVGLLRRCYMADMRFTKCIQRKHILFYIL